MKPALLIPPLDCREEVLLRLQTISAHKALNAISQLNPLATAEAEYWHRARQQGQPIAPLQGIPIVIKDNIDISPLPTTLGCIALENAKAQRDALVVRRLRGAGAIIIAKANLSEFAFDVRSRSSLAGDVHNPLMPGVTAGGSSGGCAAAVVADMAVAAIGTDTGGSIRIPCSYTGLVGLRPHHRHELLQGVAPLSPSKDCVGPMVKSVQDAALLNAIMAGKPLRPLRPASLKSMRLGVLTELEGDDPQQLRVWHAALNKLRNSGVELIDVTLPIMAEVASAPCLSLYEFHVAINMWLARHPSAPASLSELYQSGRFLPELSPFIAQLLSHTTLKTAQWRNARRFQRKLRETLYQLVHTQRMHGVIYPTVCRQPDSLEKMPPGCAPELSAISGWPALTLPCGVSATGLPVGLEILCAQPQEDLLLSLALACEGVFS
ncbi:MULTISPECIES: amidase family protein [unclassified Serratia (in: enterobacteria)]|uniref:amidase family protein n=1 Tax=unclassified Serratia (in: enterobacteria) TaxID=2647522 RepID=UPI00046A42E5|nr:MULTISPECIES: amidase [unclassified Serratia (in: enterobacteria)]